MKIILITEQNRPVLFELDNHATTHAVLTACSNFLKCLPEQVYITQILEGENGNNLGPLFYSGNETGCFSSFIQKGCDDNTTLTIHATTSVSEKLARTAKYAAPVSSSKSLLSSSIAYLHQAFTTYTVTAEQLSSLVTKQDNAELNACVITGGFEPGIGYTFRFERQEEAGLNAFKAAQSVITINNKRALGFAVPEEITDEQIKEQMSKEFSQEDIKKILLGFSLEPMELAYRILNKALISSGSNLKLEKPNAKDGFNIRIFLDPNSKTLQANCTIKQFPIFDMAPDKKERKLVGHLHINIETHMQMETRGPISGFKLVKFKTDSSFFYQILQGKTLPITSLLEQTNFVPVSTTSVVTSNSTVGQRDERPVYELSDETLQSIVKYSSVDTRVALSQVCRRLRKFADSHIHWNSMLLFNHQLYGSGIAKKLFLSDMTARLPQYLLIDQMGQYQRKEITRLLEFTDKLSSALLSDVEKGQLSYRNTERNKKIILLGIDALKYLKNNPSPDYYLNYKRMMSVVIGVVELAVVSMMEYHHYNHFIELVRKIFVEQARTLDFQGYVSGAIQVVSPATLDCLCTVLDKPEAIKHLSISRFMADYMREFPALCERLIEFKLINTPKSNAMLTRAGLPETKDKSAIWNRVTPVRAAS